jgi:putative flippase GtrA
MMKSQLIQKSLLLVRFYQAGILNTIVGYGLYASFIRLGINIYLAQIMSHSLGTAFNYFTYSRHAFRGSRPAKLRFIMAYIFNYLVGLGLLSVVRLFVRSPYIVGIIVIFFGSLINFFVLRHLVFRNIAARVVFRRS